MALAYFGDRDPVGRRIAWTDELLARFMGVGSEWRTVVGVAEDTRDGGLDTDVAHTIYNAYPQVRLTGSLIVRASGDPAAIVPAVREAILAHDPTQPVVNVATIADLGSESVAPRRLNAMLLGGFALLALVIAAVGIGGVLAYSVGSRTREFGVRSALGAARRQIWSGVVAEGAALATVGIALGSIAAVVLTRFISQLLVGVPPLDPVTFVAVAVLLTGVAIIAAWMPAWRAAGVSPLEALASE
jgi:ABC-type antimicrobial peptide transport system permease subunit